MIRKLSTTLALCFAVAFAAYGQCQTPSIKCIDSSFQLTAVQMHNPTDGSNIGGKQPTNYGYTHAATIVSPSALEYYVEGGPYATMMAFMHRPLLYGNNLQWDFDLTFTASITDFQIVETDSMLQTTGLLGNGSVQLNLAEGGQFQIVNGGGTWLDVAGAKPGIPSAGTHHYTIKYSWNTTAHTFSVVSIAFDGTTYAVPSTMQNVTMKASTWADGVNAQFQATLNGAPKHSAISAYVDNAVYTWTAN